jgi:hypothetical protein
MLRSSCLPNIETLIQRYSYPACLSGSGSNSGGIHRFGALPLLGTQVLASIYFVQPFCDSSLRSSRAYCSGVNPNLLAKLTWLAFSFILLEAVLRTAGATTVLGFERVSGLAFVSVSSISNCSGYRLRIVLSKIAKYFSDPTATSPDLSTFFMDSQGCCCHLIVRPVPRVFL